MENPLGDAEKSGLDADQPPKPLGFKVPSSRPKKWDPLGIV